MILNFTVEGFFFQAKGNNILQIFDINFCNYVSFSVITISGLRGGAFTFVATAGVIIRRLFVEAWSSEYDQIHPLIKVMNVSCDNSNKPITFTNFTVINTLACYNMMEFSFIDCSIDISYFLSFANQNANTIFSIQFAWAVNLSQVSFISNINNALLMNFYVIFHIKIEDSNFIANSNSPCLLLLSFCTIDIIRNSFLDNQIKTLPLISIPHEEISLEKHLETVFQKDKCNCPLYNARIDAVEFSNNSLKNEDINSIFSTSGTSINSEFIGTLVLTNSKFINNSFFISTNSEFLMGSPCLFSIQTNLTLEIISSQFTYNLGMSNGNCISVQSLVVQITDSIFLQNQRKDNGENTNEAILIFGGALNLMNCKLIQIIQTSFFNNSAHKGGAVYIELASENDAQIQFLNVTADSNLASDAGAFLEMKYDYDTYFTFRISFSVITNNHCLKGAGGAVILTGLIPNVKCSFEVISNIFRKNKAGMGGGVFAFFLNFCNSHFMENIFEGNSDTSEFGGGVFFICANINVTTTKCIFKENLGSSPSEISIGNYQRKSNYFDFQSEFQKSLSYSNMITSQFSSSMVLNGSIFKNIFFNQQDHLINCGGESLALFISVNFINITATKILSIILITGNIDFLMNGTLFLNIEVNGSIFLLTKYFNDQIIYFHDCFFLNISIKSTLAAFYLYRMNNDKICFQRMTFNNFNGQFLMAATVGILLNQIKVENFRNDNTTTSTGFFRFVACFVSIQQVSFQGYGLVDCDFILGFIYSEIHISKLLVNNSEINIWLKCVIQSNSSLLFSDNFMIINVNSNDYFISADRSQVYLTNFSVIREYNDNYLSTSAFFSCLNCDSIRAENGVIKGLNFNGAPCFFIKNLAMEKDTASLTTIHNLTVIKTNSLKIYGPLTFFNALVVIQNSRFLNNSGFMGGALYFFCKYGYDPLCSYSLNSCYFFKNTAIRRGGGFYWQNSLPQESDCAFVGNDAPYGANKSSNAIKIFLLQGPPTSLYSGEIINNASKSLIFQALDYYDQQAESSGDSAYLTVNFNLGIPNSKFLGDENSIFSNGLAKYLKYGVKAKPNSTTELLFWTGLIQYFSPYLVNDSKHRNYNGGYSYAIPLNLRPCLVGEIFNEKDYSCQKCKPNYYSLDLSDKECKECMPNAICLGGNEIQVLSGYWRSDVTSSALYRCNILKFGCKGGKTNDLCNIGYEGPLCGVCTYNTTHKYFRNAMGYCELCKKSNLLYAIIVFVLIFLILVLLIYFSIQESYEYSKSFGQFSENDVTVLMNILINYLQKISIVSNIEIKWPSSGTSSGSLSIFNDFGNIIGVFECPFSEFALSHEYPLFSLKRTMSTVMFFSAVLGGFLFWIVKGAWNKMRAGEKQSKRKINKRIIDNMTITLIAIYVIGLQPILNFFTKSLYCIEIDGVYYLKLSTNLKCWEGEHMALFQRLILSVSVFFIIPPLFLLYYITKNRKNRRNQRFLLISYLVTTGYQRRFFYWEYILLFVKILLMLLSIFLNGSPIICVMILMLVFFIFIHIQSMVAPFEKKIYNQLEMLKISAIYFSYAANFFFYYEDFEWIMNLILFLMGLVNCSFLIVWVFLLYRNVKETLLNFWNALVECYKLRIRKQESKGKDHSGNSKTKDSLKGVQEMSPNEKNEKRKKVGFRNRMAELEIG